MFGLLGLIGKYGVTAWYVLLVLDVEKVVDEFGGGVPSHGL